MSAPAAAAPTAEPAKKSKKKLFIIIGATLIVLLGGVGATFYVMAERAAALAESVDEEDEQPVEKKPKNEPKKKKKKKVTAKESGPPVDFYAVDPWFTFNLMDKDPERTGQIGIVYEITDKKAGDALKQKLPIIRSKILLLITGKLAQDIRTPENKQKLADEILGLTRGVLEDSGNDEGIKAVHFAIFVIQ
ncbi:MAG: flagellar basal body-associated protein FliL [Burkholderiales bacterium]